MRVSPSHHQCQKSLKTRQLVATVAPSEVLCRNRAFFITSYLNGLIDFYNFLIRVKKFILVNILFLLTLFGLLRIPIVFFLSLFNLSSSINYETEEQTLPIPSSPTFHKPRLDHYAANMDKLDKILFNTYATDLTRINETKQNAAASSIRVLNRSKSSKSKKRNAKNVLSRNGKLYKMKTEQKDVI